VPEDDPSSAGDEQLVEAAVTILAVLLFPAISNAKKINVL